MNKVIITMISIIVVIVAILTAVVIFNPNRDKDTPQVKMKIAEEEIFDDCTDEYEGMKYENTVKANTQQEKTSPNCSITIKTYYNKCGHTTSEYLNLPQDLVNLTKEEIQEKYQGYEIESFAGNEISLYQEKEGECGEHYIIKDKDGLVTIYHILEDRNSRRIRNNWNYN